MFYVMIDVHLVVVTSINERKCEDSACLEFEGEKWSPNVISERPLLLSIQVEVLVFSEDVNSPWRI